MKWIKANRKPLIETIALIVASAIAGYAMYISTKHPTGLPPDAVQPTLGAAKDNFDKFMDERLKVAGERVDRCIKEDEARHRRIFAIGFWRGAKWEAKQCDIIFSQTPDGNEATAEGYRVWDWATKEIERENKEKK